MKWLLRKLEGLLGLAFAVAAGLAASQLLAFIQQYLQRLGGHLDEVTLQLHGISDGVLYPGLDPAIREKLADAVLVRVRQLSEAHEAIQTSGALLRPFRFLAHLDPDIARAALADFQPALPLDVASLIIAAVGMVLAWLVYGLLRLLFVTVAARWKGPRQAQKMVK